MLPENLSEIWELYDKPKIFVLANGNVRKCFFLDVPETAVFWRQYLPKASLHCGGYFMSELGVFSNETQLRWFTIHSDQQLNEIKEKLRQYKLRQKTEIEVLLD